VHQREPADQRKPELQPGAAHGDAGEFRPAQQPRQQGRQCLQHGHRQRQHDREMADFDQVLTRRHQNGFPGFRRGGGKDSATMRGGRGVWPTDAAGQCNAAIGGVTSARCGR
jgi:hypothetical protein